MKKKIAILGSTGSIGSSTLAAVRNENFKIKLLSTNKNILKIFKQAIKYNVKDIIVVDEARYKKYKYLFKKNKIRLHFGFKNIDKILKKKSNLLYKFNYRNRWIRTNFKNYPLHK